MVFANNGDGAVAYGSSAGSTNQLTDGTNTFVATLAAKTGGGAVAAAGNGVTVNISYTSGVANTTTLVKTPRRAPR